MSAYLRISIGKDDNVTLDGIPPWRNSLRTFYITVKGVSTNLHLQDVEYSGKPGIVHAFLTEEASQCLANLGRHGTQEARLHFQRKDTKETGFFPAYADIYRK